MEARDEYDSVVHDAIEKPIRKSMDEGAMSFAVHDRIGVGAIKHRLHGTLDFCEKLLTKSCALRVVPDIGAHHIRCCRVTEYVLVHRERARI